MALITKVATAGTTNLAATTAWDPAQLPTLADEARWLATSLGGTLSGAFSALQLIFNGATADVTHSSGSTITLGANGWVCASTNNRSWNENGAISVSTNQTWAFAHSAQSSFLRITSSGSLSSDGVTIIQFTNSSGIASNGYASILVANQCTGLWGTIVLNDHTAIIANSADAMINAKLEISGTGCALYPAATNQGLGSYIGGGRLTINNNVALGFAGRTFTIVYPIVLGSTRRTLNVAGTTVLSDTISGTAGFTKAGAGTLVIGGPTSPTRDISGHLDITEGVVLVGASFGAAAGNGVLSYISSAYIGTSLQYQCLDAFSVPFTLTSAPGGQLVSMATLNTMTSDTSGFLGSIILHTTSTGTANKRLNISRPLNSAQALEYRMTFASPAVSDQTFAFTTGSTNPTGVYPAAIRLAWSANGTLSCNLVNNANSGIETTFSGNVTKIYYTPMISSSSRTVTFSLGGTNNRSILSGVISEGGTAGALSLTKFDTGKWTLTGTNTHKGTNTINAGTLAVQNSSALGPDSTGSGGAVAITGGTLELSGGITLDKSGLALSTVSTASPTVALQVPDNGGTNTLECAGITLNSATVVMHTGANAVLRLRNTGAISGTGFGISKTGSGELDLGATANSYTGATSTTAGTLTVGASCAPSVAGPLGNASSTVVLRGASPASLSDIGFLKYNGAGAATISRALQFTGASSGSAGGVDASGTGALTVSNATITANISYFYLAGSNTLANTFSSNISTGELSKLGAGLWRVTGTLTVNTIRAFAGDLNLGGSTRTLGSTVIYMGNARLSNDTATVSCQRIEFQSNDSTLGVVRAPLAGSTQVSVNAAGFHGRLYPASANGSNSYTGTTTVPANCSLTLATDATPATVDNGKVTGASAVTVFGNIDTPALGVQRGQARYGGNVTFKAGSKLRLGVAA